MLRRVEIAIVLATLATPALAQDLPVHEGQRVFVQSAGFARELDGRVLRISEEALILKVNERRVELPLDSVIQVQIKAHDPVMDGALLGALIVGGLCAAVCGQGLDDAGSLPSVIASNAAVGGVIGALIDASKSRRQTIYRQPPRSSDARSPRMVLFLSLRF